jgi:hypothetical protein
MVAFQKGAGHGHGENAVRKWARQLSSRKKKPIIDQMTDLAAEAAGTLAETARNAFYVAYLTSGAAARLAASPCL